MKQSWSWSKSRSWVTRLPGGDPGMRTELMGGHVQKKFTEMPFYPSYLPRRPVVTRIDHAYFDPFDPSIFLDMNDSFILFKHFHPESRKKIENNHDKSCKKSCKNHFFQKFNHTYSKE